MRLFAHTLVECVRVGLWTKHTCSITTKAKATTTTTTTTTTTAATSTTTTTATTTITTTPATPAATPTASPTTTTATITSSSATDTDAFSTATRTKLDMTMLVSLVSKAAATLLHRTPLKMHIRIFLHVNCFGLEIPVFGVQDTGVQELRFWI